jgi:hypothetical protein
VSAWLQQAGRPEIRNRALKVAALVGTLLAAINQGDQLLTGNLSTELVAKILMTYCVPYCVSTYAGVEAIRDRQRARDI